MDIEARLLHNALEFLLRTDMKGGEMPAYVEIKQAFDTEIQRQNVKVEKAEKKKKPAGRGGKADD